MSSPAFQRSPGQQFLRSPGQQRTRGIPLSASIVNMMIAIMPIVGFGTFKSAPTGPSAPNFSTLIYNDDWPRVYPTLTETWTQTDGNNYSRVIQCSSYFDQLRTVTEAGSATNIRNGTDPSVLTSFSSTSLSFSYSWSTFTGIYTATLSGTRFNPLDSSSGWAAITAQATSLLANLSVSDCWASLLGGTCFSAIIVPTTTGFEKISQIDGVTTLTATLFSAATIGIPMRMDMNANSPLSNVEFNSCIEDYMNFFIKDGLAGGFVPNQGGLMCSKSVWNLNGLQPYNSIVDPPNMNDHTKIYMQAMNMDPSSGAFSFGTVALSPNYPVPVVIPSTYAFDTPEVTSSLGTPYGMLGFRSTPKP